MAIIAGLCFAPALVARASAAEPSPAAAPAEPPAGPIELARRRVAGGDLPGAITSLAAYVGDHPRDLAPARYLGDLYYRASNLAAAESTYRAILLYAPDDRETHDRLGGVYAVEDRSKEAIEQFQASLPFASAYGHLVELHRRIGDLDQFVATYKNAIVDSPYDAAGLYALGAIYRAERKTTDAIGMLNRALNLEPRSCPTLSELGSAYLDLHESDQAIGFLQRCLAIKPNDFPALVNLSSAYIESGRDSDALPLLQHANAEQPDRPDALINLGYIEDDAGRWQEAMTYYLHAIALDPLDRDAYINLGSDYSSHRLFALAEAALLKGLSIAPNDGRLHYLLGVTYADQGKRELARGEYQRAAASDEPEIARAAKRDLAVL
jgi:tetratricopeptide (TPR) repeat protein